MVDSITQRNDNKNDDNTHRIQSNHNVNEVSSSHPKLSKPIPRLHTLPQYG